MKLDAARRIKRLGGGAIMDSANYRRYSELTPRHAAKRLLL